MATRVTFVWEESGQMSYDSLMDHLMSLGADDIETEDFERPEEPKVERQKKPSKSGRGEGVALPTDGIT